MMLERTTFPPGMYLTQYQWAKKMMAVNADIVDVMLEFSSYYAEKNQQTKPRRHKLTACADYFGFKWSGDAHNALHDAQATLFCYQSIRNGKE